LVIRIQTQRIDWSDGALDFLIDVAADGAVTLARLSAPRGDDAPAPGAGLPLCDLLLAGTGRIWSGSRYAESAAGRRLRYVTHEKSEEDEWRQLRVELEDPVTGIRAEVFYRVLAGHGVLRTWVGLVNGGPQPVTVESVTSFLAGGLPGWPGASRAADQGSAYLADLDLLWAENDWLAEGRWQRRPLRDMLPDLNRDAHHWAHPRGCTAFTSEGTWSTGRFLPMGVLVDRRDGRAWAWQIEHNGGWHWQVGESTGGAYLALLGPTDAEHHWRLPLARGSSFVTVPVTVAVSAGGFEGAIAGLTAARRAARRPHEDHRRLPVIFNDYMNTLMGDPSTERLLPLISAAAQVGAEYFCIDAGWYADPGEDWWGSIGAWRPSATRFTHGLAAVLEQIRAEGMIPGLWVEPEVIGVRSPVADQLPDEAFFTRGGRRVIEQARYQLDLRHPAAVTHLDETIDFLVGELGVGYLKLDYNITVSPGTEGGGLSAGAGMLEHNRAHLLWLDRVLDRHPGLTIENCASGGMRTDYALLSRLQLQSTSDQQDYRRYPPIAAAAPAAIAPEQSAVWAYPQPEFSDDEIAFTLCSAMLGRIHLSGHIDEMSPPQRDLVAQAVQVYKAIRSDLAHAVPFWPLGLPRWPDPVVALGMRARAPPPWTGRG
jgi:alpha-galactosidase